ncbi:MAG: aminotransferase, partial [Lactobacillus iners]|nr:aminotransferase [Lactobacillus iners]
AIAATAKAMRLYLANEKDYVARENQIKEKIINYLSHKPGIHIFSPINDNFVSSILCFALEGIRGETLVHTL